jgi:cytochrome c oxidase cbb3-type subunit 4
MKEGLSQFSDTYLTSIGLMIFFLFFVGVLWWTSKAQNKALYKRIENLPLEHGGSNE